MAVETLKGTQDFDPKKSIEMNKVMDTIKKNFELYGFRPFDTPLIEYMETLTMKYEEDSEIVEEIFKVKDRGNRELGLRYDLTTPLCRYVASKPQLKKPFRRYHIAKVFRDGPLKKGRMREFYQCDGDVIGQEGQEIEGELLSLFYTTYKSLGIDVVLELNNNKILRGSLLEFGANEEDLSSYILSIDKLKKIQKEGVLKEIEEKNLDTQICSNAIDLLSSKSIEILKESSSNELLKEGVDELSTLVTLLDFQKVPYRLNFSLSRGLDIYTGNIWESYDLSNSVTSSLGAGGRYDKVIGEYMALAKGNNEVTELVPAVGISFGLVPIMSVLESNETSIQKEGLTTTLIVPLSQDCVSKAFQIANKFRNKNINTEIFYGYSMKKAFKYCDYLGVENIVILGEKDIEKNTYVLKNLKSKEETIFSL